MFNKRRFFLISKLNIVFIIFVIILYFCPVTLSKYESNSNGSAVSSIAYYVVGTDYQTDAINLMGMIPRDEDYVYNFTVSNFDSDGNLAETDLSYDLSVVTTTNLPLEYELYISNDGGNTDSNAVTLDETKRDDSDTYFRYLYTNKVSISHLERVTYNYTLKVKFAKSYNNYIYQDIVEGVRIIIDSKQVLSGENM